MLKMLFAGFFIVLSLLSGLLFFEYLTLRRHVERIVEIQDEYQTYTTTVRKVLRDYQRLKEGDEEGSSYEDDEKKKEQPFLVLNREPSYLKASALSYLKKNRVSPARSGFYEADEFVAAGPHYELKRRQPVAARRKRQRKGSSLVSSQLAQHRALLRGTHHVADITFIWPINRSDFWISSFFGSRRKPDRTWGFHYGIDLAAIKGTPVNAVADGVVVEAGVNKGYGNTVVIAHNNKYKTRYAHLHKIYVRHGSAVKQGQRIGAVGDTGLVRKHGRYASHLHLEVYLYGKRINPLYFFM